MTLLPSFSMEAVGMSSHWYIFWEQNHLEVAVHRAVTNRKA